MKIWAWLFAASWVFLSSVSSFAGDFPIAASDSFTISEHDTAVVLTVMANDDLGDPSYSVVNAGVGFKDPEEDGIWVISLSGRRFSLCRRNRFQ